MMVTLKPFDLHHIGPHFKWGDEQQIIWYDSQWPSCQETFEVYIDRIQRNIDTSEVFNFLFEIHLPDNGMIGLVDIAGVDYYNRQCMIDCCIDDKKYRNKGYGSLAIQEALRICFCDLEMNKVTTTAFDHNRMWIRILEKNGFRVEGKLRQHALKGASYTDKLIYGLLHREYEADMSPKSKTGCMIS